MYFRPKPFISAYKNRTDDHENEDEPTQPKQRKARRTFDDEYGVEAKNEDFDHGYNQFEQKLEEEDVTPLDGGNRFYMANRFANQDSDDEEEMKQQDFSEPVDLLDTNPVYVKPPVSQNLASAPDLLGTGLTTDTPVFSPILGNQPLQASLNPVILNPNMALQQQLLQQQLLLSQQLAGSQPQFGVNPAL